MRALELDGSSQVPERPPQLAHLEERVEDVAVGHLERVGIAGGLRLLDGGFAQLETAPKRRFVPLGPVCAQPEKRKRRRKDR